MTPEPHPIAVEVGFAVARGMIRILQAENARLASDLARAEYRLALIAAAHPDEHAQPAVVVAFPVDSAPRNHI